MPNLMLLRLIAIGLISAILVCVGYQYGSMSVQSKWDKEKAELNAQAAKEIQEANDRVRAIERESYLKVAQTEQMFNKKLKEKNLEEVNALNRARTGGLFVNAKCPSSVNAMSGAAKNSSSGDGETRVELHQADGEFLIRFAAEADRITEQLSACQKLLEDERK
jgi:hypothetical protein